MSDADYLEKCVSLVKYAAEKQITPAYLRGVIYYKNMKLPVVLGCPVVDEAMREKLDPIVDRIKQSMGRPEGMSEFGRRPTRPRGGRPRRTTPT
jgi:hypothetical protein